MKIRINIFYNNNVTHINITYTAYKYHSKLFIYKILYLNFKEIKNFHQKIFLLYRVESIIICSSKKRKLPIQVFLSKYPKKIDFMQCVNYIFNKRLFSSLISFYF